MLGVRIPPGLPAFERAIRPAESQAVLKKITKFFQEVRVEMSKVAWPTREELLASAKVVIVISLLFALYIFIVDTGLSKIMGIILK
ncbi:MAG: preprotein translocase subunit SecE [bacterium]